MPPHLHLDYETFSQADIRDVGAYRYAFDPSTEILCAAMALGDEEPFIWHRGLPLSVSHRFDPYWDALENPEVLIYAHNAQFEMAISQALMWKTWGIQCPDLSRFRCTASLARRASLPAKLETVAEVLGLRQQKDKNGKKLIKRFSEMQLDRVSKKNPKPQPYRIRPEDDPQAFSEFLAYCQQDVRVEQEVASRLAYFDEPNNNATYSLDARINARGVPVNLSALRHAQKLIDEETAIISQQFRELTGFEVTQNAKILEWANNFTWASFENLQAETVDSFLDEWIDAPEDMADDLVKGLRLKQSIAYVSIKKVATMLACAGPHDNRIRGMLNHHGATTGRWTNSLVQFQNMKRSTIAHSEDAYLDICDGISREMLEICHGPVLEVISSCIRHFVQDGGNPLLDADYSAIEARIVCWLAGQEDALDEYRQGVDRYKVMASLIYGIPIDQVNKFPQRFIGKTAILGCGYGMGPPKFRATCEKMGGYKLPIGLEDTAVQQFRAKHKKVKQLWYDVEKAAKQAILKKGQHTRLRNLSFMCKEVEGTPFLLIKLPSGRKLAYPRPRLVDDRIVFFGHIKGVVWGDVDTYGGKLVENITQGVAADIMAQGAANAEKASYEIATLIHDQALAYHREGQTAEEFVRLLTDLPAWAEGLPIEAEGALVPFYAKN